MTLTILLGRAMAQAISRRLLAGFDSGSVHVGFVVDKVALRQVFPTSTSAVNFIPPVLH
jgi:hypothetical protein